MQQVYAIFLLLALVLPFGIKLSILGNYAFNLHYYQTVLCENKDKPALKCNGKCHLKKELQAIESQQENPKAPTLPSISNLTLEHFDLPTDLTLNVNFSAKSKFDFLENTPAVLKGYSNEIGAPPEAVV